MFKLGTAFVALALSLLVLSSPVPVHQSNGLSLRSAIPAPIQVLKRQDDTAADTMDDDTAAVGTGDDTGDDTDPAPAANVATPFKRQDTSDATDTAEDDTSDDPDVTDDTADDTGDDTDIVAQRQDDGDDDSGDADTATTMEDGDQDPATAFKRQDDSADGDGDGDDDADGEDDGDGQNEMVRRGDDYGYPYRHRHGLFGPHEHTGLAGLGGRIGFALKKIGYGLDDLVRRQYGEDIGDEMDTMDDDDDDDETPTKRGDTSTGGEDSTDSDDTESHGRHHKHHDLEGPHEHTGLSGLGDNVGDALTSLGKGLGDLLRRQYSADADDNDDDNEGDGEDDGSDMAPSKRGGESWPYHDFEGPHEHTGLSGLGDNLGDALTSLGKGLGDLLRRQDADDVDDDDNEDDEDTMTQSKRGSESRPHHDLEGPHEHTGLSGLGDNLGDALSSLGEGLGDLLRRQYGADADNNDDDNEGDGDDDGDDDGSDMAPSKRGSESWPYHDLEGPHEHTGLSGLGDNVGDALTSLGKGLGDLLRREGTEYNDDDNEDDEDDDDYDDGEGDGGPDDDW